ncbi:VWA domain-containing protein [Halovulum dunhuangense]|uniref:VWA domain-containing protein n=1 Tax=Halovulum dunhuangense TaxID=1505036 RepID=A0A849L1D2_9RHOB|nr:VWA domain-containing protein [Halovulum dunhuangense]NNU80096.1 VWA domain-containing protein [Halovulum dunhuangense]
MIARAALAALLATLAAQPAPAQSRIHLQAVQDAGATVADAQRLVPGTTDLGPDPPEATRIFRLAPETTGLYRITLDGPGALSLLAYPTPDGLPADGARPAVVARYASAYGPPAIGPVLLAAGRPYLLTASSLQPAALVLTLAEELPPPAPVPERGAGIGPGRYLFEATDAIRLTLPPGPPLRIAAQPEARAGLDARADGVSIPPGGLYPFATERAADLSLAPRIGRDEPAPLVLLDIAPAPEGLDEVEPNDTTPQPVGIGSDFAGVLLPGGDSDALTFGIDAPASLSLDVRTGAVWPGFSATLEREVDRAQVQIWSRRSRRGALFAGPLELGPGTYRLTLRREDADTQDAPYTLRLAPSPATPPGTEQEPNDTPRAATPLGPALQVRGTAGANDTDHFVFSVPDSADGRLWRVMAVGADRLLVSGPFGPLADVTAEGRRAMADALALPPGDYMAEIRGAGDYALRVMDLGPHPQGWESEPNDRAGDGLRLAFDAPVSGSFHHARDADSYLFQLGAETAVALAITPPDDGAMAARLYLDGQPWGRTRLFAPAGAEYVYDATLPAGDWWLELAPAETRTRGNYGVALSRRAASATAEPDDRPLDARPMPRSGDIAGSVGGFDGIDQVFVALPQGAGRALFACDGPGQGGGWTLWDWAGTRLPNPQADLAPVDYTPDLGGALRLEIRGGDTEADYACAMRLAPATLPAPVDAPRTLGPGTAGVFTLTDTRPPLDIPLDLPRGAVGALGCTGPDGVPIAPSDRLVELRDTQVPRDADLDGLRPFRAGEKPLLRLSGQAAPALPHSLTCVLHDLSTLARPRDRGPAAPFVPPEPPQPRAQAAVATDAPPPPGIQALMALAIPEEQPRGDLPLAFAFADLPPFAAYSAAGQGARVTAQITNRGPEPLDLTFEATAQAEGWQVVVDPARATLAPGATLPVTLALRLPPWQSPVLAPPLALIARAGDRFAADLLETRIDANTPQQSPFVWWSAPDALRGGLNLLHHGLGARLIAQGDAPVSDADATRAAAFHDGLAPHVGAPLASGALTFRLAAPGTLAGAMIQLRSTTPRGAWPDSYAVDLSRDGTGWRRVAAGALDARHGPQFVIFDRPQEAAFLRVGFPSCRGGCDRVAVQEIQAIAPPGTHPEGLAPINAADPALGGHVVAALPNHSGNWNEELLTADPDRRNSGWAERNSPQAIVLGFHQNRAALIERLAWVGNPADAARPAGAEVAISTESPAGPWRTIGTLPAPPPGADRAELVPAAPVWARYVRVTVDIAGDQVGPDAILAHEAPGTSVLGLWEDDAPAAAFEAQGHGVTPAVPEPSGGPDRDRAVTLAPGTPVRSSVVLERNEDWWRIVVPDGPPQELSLAFAGAPLEVEAELADATGAAIPLAFEQDAQGTTGRAVLAPGDHFLRMFEPPRSVVIAWDTSGSVAPYIPRTLAAVRTWGASLQPGRDALQLLPFGSPVILPDFADTPEALAPWLRELPSTGSSDAEGAMRLAAEALRGRRGARGVVIITDAETSADPQLWPQLLAARPRVVSLSIDSDSRQNAAILMDWAAMNGGRFQRVVGPLGLADGLDMAAALFRAPKPYALAATLAPYAEPEGIATLTLAEAEAPAATPTGAIEVILDASGSMLQRLDGRRRIEVAHDALARLVRETLPPGTPFAFRAFGLQEDSCRTELQLPLAPLDPATAEAAIRGVPAVNLARTAIADSLRAAATDLAGSTPPRVIVLVTDGEETCEGDPAAAIETLRASGLDVRVNIVGFAIDDAGLAESFRSWATAGGGAYFDAGNAAALDAAMTGALTPRFDILRRHPDGRIEAVGSAALGDTVEVPAGTLILRPASAATGPEIELRLAPDAAATLDYRAGRGLSARPG